jgi:hypothetical protein
MDADKRSRKEARIDPAILAQVLRYEPETGKLFWRKRHADTFKSFKAAKRWNTRYSGKEAFTSFSSGGYMKGFVFSVAFKAHRVIWAIQTSSWPASDVDHINGERADNRWANLRLATRSENLKNAKSRQGASSSYLGVYRDKRRQKWCARITASGKRICLGSFSCEAEAARTYDAAARIYHGDFARPNFPDLQTKGPTT